MAVSFVARKCTQCAGKLKYIKEKKLWQCMYCGAEIEREESYDGLFTIKNVVRQSLMDTAYRRLDSAQKNLIECEKIDSRYIGTLIAKIAYEMITVITPGACDSRDVKNMLSQLKKNYEQLCQISTSVTDEEEALYEFLEESDIFATLLLVYDSLNDTGRRNFVAELIETSSIYSKPANTNLLNYYIKNGNTAQADLVLSNAENLDVPLALGEVLGKYPDNPSKADNIAKLFATGQIHTESKPVIDNYLNTSNDSVAAKSSILITALNSGMRISLQTIIDAILCKADCDQIQTVLSCLLKSRLNDEDILRLIVFAFECGKVSATVSVLSSLKDSDQYVVMPAKYIISMLSKSEYTASEKVEILKASFAFKIENKALESILSNYLCFNQDTIEERKPVIECLFEKAPTFPTAIVESYVLKCSTDGERKAEVIVHMFEKGLTVSFFNDLLSRYMETNIDEPQVQANVIDTLVGLGMKVDPAAFVDYICDTTDDVPSKIKFIKKMVVNGAQLRGDAANRYLEKTAPDNFSSELFSLIFTPASAFSAKAVENYLLYFRDRDAVKAKNAITIMELSSGIAENLNCRIVHLNNGISCNLLQAYTLMTTDCEDVALEIANYLSSTKRLKINEEMTVSGASMKLKKYVVANRGSLSSATNTICEKYKVYSMFF